MKSTLVLVLLLIAFTNLKAQKPVPINNTAKREYKDLKTLVGKEIYVVDSVYSGRSFDSHTLLNIGGSFPNQLLTVFIDKKDYPNFADDVLKLFLHKKINVFGKLTEYNGKVQIILNDPKKQIDQKVLKKGLHEVI
ncbi:hypothetical protein [Pedobacter sp. UYP24]